MLSQVKCGPRKPGTPEHIKCRDTISDEMKKTCDDVHFQEFTHHWSTTDQDITLWNVIGTQNWKDATVHVALIAHWDTRAASEMETDPAGSKKPSPGANDGASGVAVLLELSRVLKGHLPQGVGIEYVMTDGEDLGPAPKEMFLGARAFVQDFANHTKPDYAIVVNMVGTPNLQMPMEVNSVEHAKSLMYAIWHHAASIGMSDVFPLEIGPKVADDHLPLLNAGLPAIDLIAFRVQYWHTLEDTPDTCSADSLGKVGKLLQTWLQKDPPYTPGG